jgi:hypothetical protein
MSKFLNDFLVTMPTTQRSKLLELLEMKQKEGLIRSDYELQAELERLMNDIESRQGGPTFQARQQSGQTDSKSYNSNMEEIAFDLMTLFDASATIDRLMGENKQLSKSLITSVKKQIFALQSRLERHRMLLKNTDGFVDGIHESFISPQCTEANEKELKTFRKDRFDMYLNKDYSAEHVGNALQLAGLETIDQLKTNYGRRLARVEVINRTGHASENPEHGIEKAIDGSLDSYWAESILVDEPITQNIDDLWKNDYTEYPKDGAICEMQITLNGITTVSDIQFDPFCSYPLEVVSIYGYETADMGGEVHELISPNHLNPHQRSQKSVNQMTFQFPSVDISVIRLLLRQENYVKENYIVDKDEQQSQELWRKLSSEPALIQDYKNTNETIAEFDRKNEVTGWSVYLEKLNDWANKMNATGVVESAKSAMETIRMGDYKNPLLLKLRALSPDKKNDKIDDPVLEQSWSAVNKLSYLYGAYNISVFGRKYQNKSIYVSKPLQLSSNATRISLETVEKHHDREIGNSIEEIQASANQTRSTARITDIEFYLTHKKNPTATDWHPILPAGKSYVEGELLTGDMIQGMPYEFAEQEAAGNSLVTYSLRFTAISDQNIILRRNGIVMSPSTYIVSEDGRRIGIFSKFYAAASVYTVDYKPADDAWFVNLDEANGIVPAQYIDKNGETGEVFQSVDTNNSLELKHKPYLFRQNLFVYDEDELDYKQTDDLSASSPEFPMIVRVNGEEYVNVTDYATNTYDHNRLSENEGKAFAQIGRRLIFGRRMDGGAIENITVDYYYVATDIRLKAIFRRNSAEDQSVTPALYSYHVRCQSFDQEV